MPLDSIADDEVASVVSRGCAIELLQIRTSGVREKTFAGEMIHNTPEAIRKEMRNVWARLRGKEGEEMRRSVEALRGRLRASWKDGGARRVMLEFEEVWR